MSEGGIGRYEILHKLGEGGMAETYVAVRRGPAGFSQRVCLKRIRAEQKRDHEFIRQFLAEARIAATLRHATLAQVLDFGEQDGDYFLALELVEGVDLRKLLSARARLTAAQTLLVATELATALDVAHRAPNGGIVHRDVSPSNVLVSAEGEVKLTDFGIAKVTREDPQTRSGIVKGKVPYMAPEYARSARCDARCDLFALGVLGFECLTGVRPYDGETDLDTLERAASGRHRPLRELAPDAPQLLTEAIERLLDPDPELRFQSAAELLSCFEGLSLPMGVRRELAAAVRELPQGAFGAPAHHARAEEVQSGATEPLSTQPTVVDRGAATRTAASDAPPGGDGTVLVEAGELGRASMGKGPLVALAAALAAASLVALLWLSRAPSEAATQVVEAPRPVLPQASPEPPAITAEAQVDQPEHAGAGSGALPPEPAAPPPVASTVMTAAQPEPKPRSAKATLNVSVMPYGAVQVDGQELGRSPVSVKVAPGEHRVIAIRNGRSFERVVRVRAGETQRIMFE